MYKIGELSKLTDVKKCTIRFYEKCGFLEKVNRLENGYRVYTAHHIYQVTVCKLVFSGFISKKLRKASMKLIYAAQEWNLSTYEKAADEYIKVINEDIDRTRRVIDIVSNNIAVQEYSSLKYTKKQAAKILGTTAESIRNWERNALIPSAPAYQKRYYTEMDLDRMRIIRLLLDTGYSIMAIHQFFYKFENGTCADAKNILINPEANEALTSRADSHLQALLELNKTANTLYGLYAEMKNL